MFVKKQYAFALSLACSLLVGGNTVCAKELVIAISPNNNAETIEPQINDVLNRVLAMEPDDRATVIDGYNLKTIGDFTIPTDPRYKSKKIRININKKAVAELLQFARNPPIDGAVHKGAVKLPELLGYISDNIKGDGPLDVVVIGSALYHDPQEPAFTMQGRHIPGDGHFNHSRRDTPFGTIGEENRLNDVQVHLAYTDKDAELGGRYETHVGRFWTLFAEGKGATLVTFSKNISDTFRNIQRGVKAPMHNDRRADTDKLEMIEYRPVEREVKQSIFKRPVSQTPLPKDEVIRANNLEIGIAWHDCQNCDLDLYSMANPSAQILYFSNTRSSSPRGRYWKDYTQSPDAVNGFETISYSVPLDLRAVHVGINFYGGIALNGVSGEVRISVNGQTYSSPFKINARKGVGSGGAINIVKAGHSNRPQTVIVDVLKIVGASAS